MQLLGKGMLLTKGACPRSQTHVTIEPVAKSRGLCFTRPSRQSTETDAGVGAAYVVTEAGWRPKTVAKPSAAAPSAKAAARANMCGHANPAAMPASTAPSAPTPPISTKARRSVSFIELL